RAAGARALLGGLQQEGPRSAGQLPVDADRCLAVCQQPEGHRTHAAVPRPRPERLRVRTDCAGGHGWLTSSSLWKQLCSPVWHAGPTWSTLTRMASPSQSSATDLTYWKCPDVWPLTQYSCRLRDQY